MLYRRILLCDYKAIHFRFCHNCKVNVTYPKDNQDLHLHCNPDWCSYDLGGGGGGGLGGDYRSAEWTDLSLWFMLGLLTQA